MRLFKRKARKPAFGPDDFLTVDEINSLRPKETRSRRSSTEEKRLAGQALIRDADFEAAVAKAHAVLDGEDDLSIAHTVAVATVGHHSEL